MNNEALLLVFVAVNALTSTGTLLGVIHLWKKIYSQKAVSAEEEELLEKNLNTRLRDLQMTRFSLRFPERHDTDQRRR